MFVKVKMILWGICENPDTALFTTYIPYWKCINKVLHKIHLVILSLVSSMSALLISNSVHLCSVYISSLIPSTYFLWLFASAVLSK